MKTQMTLVILIVFAAQLWGQSGGTCPKFQYTYDAAGNRIKRQYVTCLKSDEETEFFLKAVKQDNNSPLNANLSKVNLNAYPNPNNGIFQILIENPQENTVLDLYDFTGRKVFSQNSPSTSVSMNLSNLVTGTYILMYRNPERVLGKLKLVIE